MISKNALHVNNKHRQGYHFDALVKAHAELSTFIIQNKHNQQSTIDFSNNDAVVALNTALLKCYYQIQFWGFPKGYLCPPIPGRVDYIHYLADLLKETPSKVKGKVSVLDIGTGASCIYPILGAREYNWHFIASDIDPISIKAAEANISANKNIEKHIKCRLQKNSANIFDGIIKTGEYYHLTLCNPPFHKSLADAHQGTSRKWQNLAKQDKKPAKAPLNFGGQKAEL
ncbi:MAG: 23S rRNA (adenine(1618)-N(6))-methyltransferase RlmF, partial [Colwellia sp.]|nr:23S rRNA (adenine(1618)-N(6))-methyltransferase RlmF [Colwellia sp.]